MANSLSPFMGFLLRATGDVMPNNWGKDLNDDILRLEFVLLKVCSPVQLAEIRQEMAKNKVLQCRAES